MTFTVGALIIVCDCDIEGASAMNIKKCRMAVGLTQKDLANYMGVSRTAISNWECGITCPKADDLPKLATFLRCSIDNLFDFESTNNLHQCQQEVHAS